MVLPVIEYDIFENLLQRLRDIYSPAKADRAFLWFHEKHTPEFKNLVDPVEYIQVNEAKWLDYEF